jgi:hypothetical protein
VNIEQLKVLVANLPAECTPEQFSQVELEVEDILARQRQADEAELQAMQEKVAALAAKLGRPVTPTVTTAAIPAKPQRRADSETDFDAGIDYHEREVTLASFNAELADLRRRGVAKRRNRVN